MGASMITDLLFTSPILQGEDAQANAGMAAGVAADGSAGMVVDAAAGGAGVPGAATDNQFGGINYNMDPELAHAIQISMQEERARQGEEAKQPDAAAAATSNEPAMVAQDAAGAMIDDDSDSHDEEYYIQQAKMLSMGMPMDGSSPAEESISNPPDSSATEPQKQTTSNEPKPDLNDIVNTDFMKDIIGDLGLDIDKNEVDKIQNDAGLGSAAQGDKDQKDGKNDKKDAEDGADKKKD